MADSSDKLKLPIQSAGLDETIASPTDEPALAGAADTPTIDAGKPPATNVAAPIPSIPGYEIIEELGRGGMGVVYKANDTKLQRVVALKMILGGRLASAEEVARFRLEAEAAARLDHPGIVPVYGVDQANDHRYFSMKYIEGTPLSHHKDCVIDARDTVDLLHKVARAVHHAHERGILHRDLKPSNILIDADGQPHVTDFGLAKQLGDDSGVTQTGAAMGTPGYMAPEQAKGERDITTAVDVFSLGAILYWMQTGETPFKGETPMQRLMSTIQEEVPSTRVSNPNADSGLDLICQKAMSRDPQERYGSVASFADDLKAWLDGEPLSVRPPKLYEIARRWVRSNLRTALGASLAGAVCGAILGVVFNLDYLHSLVYDELRTAPLDNQATWFSGLSWINDLDSGWADSARLVSPIVVAICVLLTVISVRPKTRETNIVAAATAGLAALAFSLLTGIGWAQMAARSIENADIDIQFLASALWMESPQEKELAQAIMSQRYPGLDEVAEDYRGSRLATNIVVDQTKGLLPGMWFGAWVALLVAAIPMSISCFLCGHLWQQGRRGARWFVPTLEQCFYCLFAFSTVALLVDSVAPQWNRVFLCVLVMILGLVTVVLHKPWYLRFVMLAFAAWTLLGVLSNQDSIRHATLRAGYARADDQLRTQLHFANVYLDQKDDSHARYQTAIGWLYLGEQERYLAHCENLFDNYQPGSAVGFAEQLAKVSLLRPNLHPVERIEVAHRMADLASAFDSAEEAFWMFMTRGLAEQRRGKPAEALKWSQKARDDADHTPHYMHACSHAIDALAHLDRNDVGAASISIRTGRAVFDATVERTKNRRDVGWVDRLIYLLLEREVRSRGVDVGDAA